MSENESNPVSEIEIAEARLASAERALAEAEAAAKVADAAEWMIYHRVCVDAKEEVYAAKKAVRLAKIAAEAAVSSAEKAILVESDTQAWVAKTIEWIAKAAEWRKDQITARRAALEEEARQWVNETLAKEAVTTEPKDHYLYVYLGAAGPFYIGIGTGDEDVQHLRDSAWMRPTGSLSAFYVRLRKMATENQAPTIRRLVSNLTKRDARNYQAFFIKLLGRQPAGPLLNKSDGGNTGRPAATLGVGNA